MIIKVCNIQTYKPVLTAIHIFAFDLDIDDITTRCYTNFNTGDIIIHWKAGGSRVLRMGDYIQTENMDMYMFIAENLEDAPLYDTTEELDG